MDLLDAYCDPRDSKTYLSPGDAPNVKIYTSPDRDYSHPYLISKCMPDFFFFLILGFEYWAGTIFVFSLLWRTLDSLVNLMCDFVNPQSPVNSLDFLRHTSQTYVFEFETKKISSNYRIELK